MDKRTCEACGVGLTRKPGPGRWPKRCSDCRLRRMSQPERSELAARAARSKLPIEFECVICGSAFSSVHATAAYCSGTCRNKAKYQRLRSDPQKWENHLAAHKARYQPHPRQSEDRRCNQDGCDDKHLARGMCRRHYYQWRRDEGLDGSSIEIVVLQALCSRGYALTPKVKSVRCAVPVGIMPDCPACKCTMRPLSPHYFVCPHCWTDAAFNPEEVAWLANSVRRSMNR